MARENVVKLIVSPKLDAKALKEVMDDFTNAQKNLNKFNKEWIQISKQTQNTVSKIADISKATKEFTNALGSGVKSSVKHLQGLGEELDGALKQAEALQQGLSQTEAGSKAEEAFKSQLEATKSKITGLNKSIEDAQKKYKGHANQINRISQSYEKLQDSAKYGIDGFFKDMGNAFKGGGPASIGKSLTAALGKGAASAGTRAGGLGPDGAGPGAAGPMASAMGAIAKALPALTLAIGAVTMFWQALSAASDHMANLNKALLSGSATANDFVSDAGTYRSTIDDLRKSSIAAAGGLLRYGANSETAAKVINKFAMESTGSLAKTRSQMIDFGKTMGGPGSALDKGVESFTVNAIAYGKALGMEAEDAAEMMGKLVSETGIGADNVQNQMENIVKSAATANMPMTKFMGIFRSVLPDVELYQNRLEELTGTIKLLSRTMNPRDVQKFMDAFAKGFKGVDFKQRLKTVLVAGTGFVSEVLEKDFNNKAKALAKNFKKFASQEEVAAAIKGGEGATANLIATMRSRAAKEGKTLDAADIANAMKLAGYEAARAKGDALSMATALKGSGVYGTYKILAKMGGTLTQGFDGISEQVMSSLGISQEQQEMLRTTAQTLQAQRSELKMYGRTSSKSFNKSLEEVVKQGKENMSEAEVQEAMRNATDDQLFEAAEMNTKQDKAIDTAKITANLAAEQTNATLSISEKISNVIAFLLEKLYGVLQPILDVLNDLWAHFTTKNEDRDVLRNIANNTAEFAKMKGGEVGEEMIMFGDKLEKAVSTGKKGEDLIEAVGDSMPSIKDLQETQFSDDDLIRIAKRAGGGSEWEARRLGSAVQSGDTAEISKILAALPNAGEALYAMKKMTLEAGKGVTEAAREQYRAKQAGERTEGRISLTKEEKSPAEIEAEKAAAEAGDLVDPATGLAAEVGKVGDQQVAAAKEAATTIADSYDPGAQSVAPAPGAASSEQSVMDYYSGAQSVAPAPGEAPSKRGGDDFERKLKGVLDTGVKSVSGTLKKDSGQNAAASGGYKIEAAMKGAAAAKGGGAPKTIIERMQARMGGGAKASPAEKEQLGISEEQFKATEDVYKTTKDVAGILRTGIIFESSFFSKYFTELKKVTLESLRTALLEHAILMAQMEEDPKVRKALAESGQALSDAGIGINKITQLAWQGEWGGPEGRIQQEVLGKFQEGGTIPATGAYIMHKGEKVTPAGGGGGGNVYNVTINGTDLSPQQLTSAVYGAMSNLERRN